MTADLLYKSGSKNTATTLVIHDPQNPATVPYNVTPPLVPGGTVRAKSVIRRGGPLANMPSSEEKVSADTAA